MCYLCCKECAGWCKSFTYIERLLSILEAVLLAVFIVLLVFLILHLTACRWTDIANGVTEAPVHTEEPATVTFTTLSPLVKCTWNASQKTAASNHYYYDDRSSITPVTATEATFTTTASTNTTPGVSDDYVDDVLQPAHEADGVEARAEYKRHVLALVKLRPPRGTTFGCILTVISEDWTLTAASCIEEIEEVDSLDSFVAMQNYGEEKRGSTYVISEVRVHPSYGRARSRGAYDVAALRLQGASLPALPLATPLDYALITIGQRLVLLGYGSFRSVEPMSFARRLREVSVFALPQRQCSASEAEPAPRHLVPAGVASCGARGAACAGVVRARSPPCNYCAGSPLLGRGSLLALQADSGQCGAACGPAPYTVLAHCRAWIHSLQDQRRRRRRHHDLLNIFLTNEDEPPAAKSITVQ